MDTVDVPGGHPSEDEVDGGKLCSTEKNLPSDNAIESQAAAGTETNVMDEKCAQNVVTDPEEQNDKLAPKTNDDSNPAERSQSASDSSTVNEAYAEKSTLDYQEAPGEPGPKAGVVCHPSEDAECLTEAGGVAIASKDDKDADSGLEKENTDDNNPEVIAGVLNVHKEAKESDSGLEKETSEDNNPEVIAGVLNVLKEAKDANSGLEKDNCGDNNQEVIAGVLNVHKEAKESDSGLEKENCEDNNSGVIAGMKEVCDCGTDQKSSMQKKTEKDVIEEDKPLNDLFDAGPLVVEVNPLNDIGESFKPDAVSKTAVNVATTPPQAETLSPPESTDECNLMEGRSDDSNDRVEELKVEHPCVSDRRPESVEVVSEHSVNSVTQEASVCAVSVALCRKSLSTADEELREPFPPGKPPNESNKTLVDNSFKETVQQQIANVTYFKCAALGNVNDNVSHKVSGKYSQNPDNEAEHGNDEGVSVVEERSCAHIDEDKSINESNDKIEKSSLSSLEEQPKHDQNLKDERPLSTCEDHIDGSNIDDHPTDDVHQPSTDDTGPEHGVLTKLKHPDPEEAAGEPSQDVSLSPLDEQAKGDRNVIEETPLSTCEDHVDVSSSQAATDHEECDSSGELVIDEVECETSCADIDEDKSSNELDGTFANNPPADAVHQTSTVETSSDHGDLSKSKQPVPKEPVDTEEKHEGRKSGLIAEETSCTHIDEDKSPNPSNDTFANNPSTDDIHQSSTDEPSSDHGVLTKQKQPLPEEAAGEPSQDGSLSSIAEQLEHDQSIPEETPLSICEDPSTAHTQPGNHDSLRELVTDKNESSQDVSLSPLEEQPNRDRNLIDETPLSTCEDHVDVSSSQAATDHEECDSSGELVIDEVECETSCADIDEDKSSNKLDDTFSNNPPADDIHQSSTDETSSDHGTLTKQKLPVPEGATGKPSQDGSLSSIAEQLEHDQSIPEETPLSICEDPSTAHTDSGVDDSLGELVTDKHECETEHEHTQGLSGAGQKLKDQNSQCQESVDAKSHDFLTNKKTDLTEGEQDASELAVGMTRKTTESLSDEQTQETEQGARSEKCVEIGNNSEKEKLGGSGEREDTTTPEGDTGDGTDRINSCPIKKDLEQACESQPFDVDHIQSSFEDNVSQDNKIMEQPDEDACSSQDKVHDSEETCETQPFDVDHIQSSFEDNVSQDNKIMEQPDEDACSSQDKVHDSEETCETQPFDVDHFHFDKEGDSYQDVSTAKENPDEHPSREQQLAENEKLTDDSREQTVTEVAHDQDSGLRDGVFHPESGAKATFAKEDTANNAHGFVMLSPFTLTREEFDAQDKSPDLKKSNVQASIKSAKQMCDAVQTTDAGREDTSFAIGEHQSSGSSEVAEGQSQETSYLEAGDMNMMKSPEKETDVAETEDDVCQAGEEVQTGGDDEKTADNNSEDKPPQQELKLKSPEKGRISIGYSKRKDKFKCFLCDEIGSGGSFEEHVMQHLLWKPYKCLYCSQYFITRSDIGKHVSESHNGKQLRCGLRAIKKAKECMREAQRKGTCMYFADKLNGMYWSCKKKKTDHEAKLLDEKAEGTSGMPTQCTEESVQGTEESVQGTKQVPEPGFDQSDQAEVNQISMDRVLDQGNVIQPRSSDFSTSFNTSKTAMVNQGGESRNSTPDVIFTKQLVKPRDGDTVLATTNLGTVSVSVSASAPATATATVPQPVAATITAQVQAAIPAATQAAIPAQALTTVQPITSPVHNSLQSIIPGTISPQSMNVQVIQSTGLTVPAIPVFLNHISGGVKTPVVSDASITGFTSVLTSPPASNSVVQQLTLSPPKIMPRSHIISSDPNKIILGNPATVPVNQGLQSNMQPILIPVSLNTNVNQFGVTPVSSKASSKGERAEREIQPVKDKGSPDGNTKSKDKQLKFHDITQAFRPPIANITILPRPPTAKQHLPLLTSFFLPSQQSSSSTPQVLNSTAASGFIPQNVSIVNPNCPVLVIQKAGYGPFMQLKSSNQTAPVESQILTHPKRQNPSEVEHAVSSKNIPPSEGQKQTLTSGSYVYKPQPSDQSKRVCVMFTVGLVNGVFVCAMCRGRFKHENSFRAHLWNHIHDANMPCPHCKSSNVSGLNILACSKTDGYMEKLKTGLVGNSSYLEIKGYRTVSNTVDSQLSNTQNEPSKAQKCQMDKSKHSQGIIDISSEVVSREPVQNAIFPEARPKGLAPIIHGDEATAKTGVEYHSGTLATGVPDQYVRGVASGTGEPSFKEQQSSNNDELDKSTAAPDLEGDLPRVKITSRTVSSVMSEGADNTEGHLPSITPNQDSDEKSKGVAKPVSSDRGDHTTGDAKDSKKLAPGSEKDLNRNAPSPVKVTTTWTFYVCGSQCGYSSLYAQEFKKHVAECNRSGSLLCSHCQYSSDGPESLLRHIVKHYVGHAPGIAVHTCSISGCRFTTNILQGYYQHLASNHTEVKEYECNYCKDVFSDLVSFMKHLQENVLHVVSCRYCSARDCAKTVLVKHIMEAHPGKSRMTNMLKQLVCKDRKDNHALSLLSPKSSSASKPAIGASTAPATEALPSVLGDGGRVDQNIVLEIDRAASPALAENTDAHLSCNETGDETSLGGSVKDASLDPVFRCSVCTYIGVDRHDLNTHIAKHDDKTSKTATAFSCTECPDGFNFLANFEIHLRRHSKLLTYNLYVCSVCKYEVGSNDVMLNHMAQIHKLTGKGQTQFSRKLKVSKTDVLNCSQCPFQCLDQNVLDVHRQKRHLSSTNKTPKQMSKDASLSNTSSNEDQVSANNKSAEKGEKPIDSHSREKGKGKLKMTIPHNSVFISPVRCISCKFSSVYKANIQRHMDKHHPEIELVVESGKIGSPLKKVVTDEAPVKLEPNDMRLQIGSTLLDTELQWLYEGHGSSYRCMICSKSLYKRNYLHGHILDHLDISLWKCKECDFKSSRRNIVKDHMKDIHEKKCHTEEVVPVVDEIRPKIFKVLGKLIQDDKLVTDVKPSLGTKELDEKLKYMYKVIGKQKICKRCETEHQSLYSMHSHIMRRHFGLHLFKCCYCDFSGLERYVVAKHSKEKHPDEELSVRYHPNNIKDMVSDEDKKRTERSHQSTTKSSSSDHSSSHERRTELRVGSDMLDQKLQPMYDVRIGKIRKLICRSCQADYPSKYSLHCHLLKHLKINLVACPHCDFELLEQSKMGDHIKVVHPRSHIYFKFLDVDIGSAVKDYLEKKDAQPKTDRKKPPKAAKPKLSDLLAKRKPASPIKHARSPEKVSKNVMSVTAGGLKRFKCRLCDYMALTKHSVGTHVFKVHKNSGTKTTTITDASRSLVPDYFLCKFCKFKTHLLELLKSHYTRKHPLETMDEPVAVPENTIESGDEGGDGYDDDDDDFTPDSLQHFSSLFAEKETCQNEEGNKNSENAHPETPKEEDKQKRESPVTFEEARVVLEKIDAGDKAVSDISERVKLKKRKEKCYEEDAEGQPAKKMKAQDTEHSQVSYKCPKCSYVDSSKTKGVLHLKKIHNVNKLMQCAYCTASYITEDTLKNHIRFLHKGKEILHQEIPLESMLAEVTSSHPSPEVSPGVGESPPSGKSADAAQNKPALPGGSSGSDKAPKPTKSSKSLKDQLSPESKESKKIDNSAEASNISSKDSSKDVSKDSKHAPKVDHEPEPQRSKYASFVPSSPDNSDHEERVYYKYVCVYCDVNINSKTEIKTHLAKHCLERLHGNKIPESEEARLKIKKKVRDIIPICVERANNKKVKVTSQPETIEPEASRAASEAETERQSTEPLKNDVEFENKVVKHKKHVQSESDSDSEFLTRPVKKCRRRIRAVISSSDEDEPIVARKEERVKRTSTHRRIYCCHLCRYKVGSLYKFRSHLASHGNFKYLNPDMSLGLVLKCGFCGFQAKDKDSFSQHVEEHLDGRIYKCGYCKYDSYHSKNMRSHLKNKHRHKPEKIIDLRISMNERARRPAARAELVNLDPIVMLEDVIMNKDFPRLLKELGVRTLDMDENMKDVILGQPGQKIEVRDMELEDSTDEEDSNSEMECRVDDDVGYMISSEGSDVPLGEVDIEDVSDEDLYRLAPPPTD
ncbi:uncharacterized protein LOC124144388 isoform X2 [Haliotis rufescens]|uniref:uncharacterized protein LOC124144388 isoform X2 n=1 Tax=Haliotis rufescens TaxID=6454 RepID=UPI00201EDD61|nr:uncharacterized protein LOC124144388 isoform X2 [Haliotis rufescens]